jgi:hypothetical protein
MIAAVSLRDIFGPKIVWALWIARFPRMKPQPFLRTSLSTEREIHSSGGLGSLRNELE